jgi:hypothetical protein
VFKSGLKCYLWFVGDCRYPGLLFRGFEGPCFRGIPHFFFLKKKKRSITTNSSPVFCGSYAVIVYMTGFFEHPFFV